MHIKISFVLVISLSLGCAFALDPACDMKHSQSFSYSSYGVKFIHIKSAFSLQDAFIIKQTDSQDIIVDVSLFTDGTLDETPVQLTGTQNGALLLVEAKVNVVISPSTPSSSVNVSGASKFHVLTSTLVLGILVQLLSNRLYAILIVSIFGLVSLSIENCSPQALFTVTVPAGVQSVCFNDQCFTSSPTANLGVAAHFVSPNDREMRMLSDAFSVVRRDLDWGSVENKAPQVYDFSSYIALSNTLLSFNTTPYWIWDYRNSFYDGGISPVSKTGIAGFVNYTLRSLAVLNGTDAVWEMYNEPNGGFWTPKANVTQFINLASAVGAAVKKNYPKEYQIGPAVSGMDFKFLEACFASGLLEYWDGVSVHPYRGGVPETAVKDYILLALMIERYKPANKPFIPIISGEWGFTTTTVSLHQQATYLPRMFLANMATDVVMSIWYDWRDDGTDPSNNEHNFGTVHNAYLASGEYPFAPKATYFAAQTLKNLTTGMRFNKRIHTDSSSVWIVMLSNTADNVILAVWSTNNVPETVSLAVSPGSFRVTNYVGNSTKDVTVSGQSLTIEATDEVQYIVPLTSNPYLQVIASVTRPPLIITEKLVDFVMFFTNPLNEAVTLDFYEQKGVTVASGQTVALWHHVDVYLDVPAYDLPIFVNFTSFGTLRMQSRVAPVFPILPVVYPTTVNGSIPVSFLSSYDLSGHVDVSLNGRVTSFNVATVAKASPVLLVDGQLAKNKTSTIALAISNGATVYTRGAPLAVSQYPDFSTVTSGSLQQTFTAWIGGDTSVAASFKISLKKPATMPIGFDSYGVLFLNSTSDNGYRYYVLDAKVDLPIAGSPTKFGQWVYGDGSGVSAGIRVVDKTGEVFQFLYPINWTGWQYVIYSFDNINDHWGGNNDRVADYPLSWLSLFVYSNPGGNYLQYQGNLYITTLVAYSFE